jgi:hypothetical protein
VNGKWVSRPIVIQIVVVSVVALVVLVLAAGDVVAGDLGPGWAVGGLLGGAVVGVVASRMQRMQWDERTDQVISKIDWLGGVILAGFLVAQLTRSWLLGHWAEGVALTTLGLCVTAGTLAGQVFGTRWAVRAARPPA